MVEQVPLAHPRFWLGWLGVLSLRALSLLPLPVVAAIGRTLGIMLYYLHSKRRHIAFVNINLCFPSLSQKAQRSLVKRHFRAFGQTLLDISIAWWGSERRLRRLVRFRHREYYDAALARKQNVILLAPHFLGLEIGGIRLSLERPMLTVFRHLDNPLLRLLIARRRQRFGVKLFEHNQSLMPLVRQLKNGATLYYLPDQDAGRRQAVFVPFFGIPAATFSVLGRLAEMARAVVIPCFTRQLPHGRGYEVVFGPPLADFPSGNAVLDARRMNEAIEAAVREMPEQYFWVHRRFKTRPEGEVGFYT